MESWKLVLAGGALVLAGVALGASLFGTERATAQDGRWRDCIIARQESVDTNGAGQIARPDIAHTVTIPPGYVPIGGGGFLADNNPTSAVVLCRR
jgi:hypothetical protein